MGHFSSRLPVARGCGFQGPRLGVVAAEVPTSRSAPAALVVFAYSIFGACAFLKHPLPSLPLIVPSL